MSKNVSLQLIEDVLNDFYANRLSKTKISKSRKISMKQIKTIIADYSEVYLNRYPNLKNSNVSRDTFREYLETKERQTQQREAPTPTRKRVATDDFNSASDYIYT
jgi:hypothetical protein